MDAATIIAACSIPSAVTGFCFWLLERKIQRREKKAEERDKAREQNELYLIQAVGASIALGEATAKAVQKIPDAHCNGDMHAALEYTEKIKHEHKEFLQKMAVSGIY